MPYIDETDIDYGHEPQYLHNVRKLDTTNWNLATVAGSHLPGIFEPDDSHGTATSNGLSWSATYKSDGSGKAGAGGKSVPGGVTGSTGKAAGSAKSAAGTSGSAKSGGTVGGSSNSSTDAWWSEAHEGAGSSFLSALADLDSSIIVASIDSASATGGGSKVSAISATSTVYADGYYSWNLQDCPNVCANRRLEEIKSPYELIAAMHRENDKEENLMTVGSQLGNYGNQLQFEDGSYKDGYAVYAKFFKPVGIAIRSDAYTLWVADAGNNALRNISCHSGDAPTFMPTQVPTQLPTGAPVPTAPKAATGKQAGKQAKVKVPAPGKGPKAWKVKKVGPKEADLVVSLVSADLFNLSESLGSSSVVVALAAAGFAGLLVSVLFYRKKLLEVVGLN